MISFAPLCSLFVSFLPLVVKNDEKWKMLIIGINHKYNCLKHFLFWPILEGRVEMECERCFYLVAILLSIQFFFANVFLFLLFQVCYFRYMRFFPSGRFLYKVIIILTQFVLLKVGSNIFLSLADTPILSSNLE